MSRCLSFLMQKLDKEFSHGQGGGGVEQQSSELRHYLAESVYIYAILEQLFYSTRNACYALIEFSRL